MSSITQIWSETPHAMVTSDVAFEGEESKDFDLEATIQFVSDKGQASHFDFSAYVLVTDPSDVAEIEAERQKVADEIAGANALLEAVEKFHGEFLAQASKALDLLASLQASTQS